jgi:hypothetical protein
MCSQAVDRAKDRAGAARFQRVIRPWALHACLIMLYQIAIPA